MRDRESGEISSAETSVLQQYFTEMLTIIQRYFTAPPFGNDFLREEEKCLMPSFLTAIRPPLANKIFQNIFLSYHTLSHFLGCQQLLPSVVAALPSTSMPGSRCSHMRKESCIVLCKACQVLPHGKKTQLPFRQSSYPQPPAWFWLVNK